MMELLGLLLSDWAGRLSLFTVLFCIGIIAYIAVYFIRIARNAGNETSAEGHLLEEKTSPKT